MSISYLLEDSEGQRLPDVHGGTITSLSIVPEKISITIQYINDGRDETVSIDFENCCFDSVVSEGLPNCVQDPMYIAGIYEIPSFDAALNDPFASPSFKLFSEMIREVLNKKCRISYIGRLSGTSLIIVHERVILRGLARLN